MFLSKGHFPQMSTNVNKRTNKQTTDRKHSTTHRNVIVKSTHLVRKTVCNVIDQSFIVIVFNVIQINEALEIQKY